MKLSINLRNWGPQSTPELLLACARAADESGLDTLWVNEHIAIPPDWSSGALPDLAMGRILDPLATLAFLASATHRIGLGTAVLLLPYRPALPTAKWVATIQELSGKRLRLGVGVGWMEPEFRALGVERAHRGRITDEILAFLQRCFENDVVEANGQPFLFRPRPERPPIYIGGAPPHGHRRAVRFGDGWIPAGIEPEELKSGIQQFHTLCAQAGRPPLEVVAMKTLPLDDPSKALDYARRFVDAGATHLVHTQGYKDAEEYQRNVDILEEKIRPALAS